MLSFFNKRNPKKKYIVKYIYSCDVNIVRDGTRLFDTRWEQECVVEADDIMGAGVEFAKTHMLIPNVCITSIKEIEQ